MIGQLGGNRRSGGQGASRHITLPEGSGPFATILELSLYFHTELGGDTWSGPTSNAQATNFQSQIVISTGKDMAGAREIPVVKGDLRFGG